MDNLFMGFAGSILLLVAAIGLAVGAHGSARARRNHRLARTIAASLPSRTVPENADAYPGYWLYQAREELDTGTYRALLVECRISAREATDEKRIFVNALTF
jgi:hypothetical protein